MFHKCLHLDLNETKMVPLYATMLMNSLEGDILSNSLLKSLVWWHYIDYIFIMWERGEEELQKFLETLNCYHPTINLQQNTPGQK